MSTTATRCLICGTDRDVQTLTLKSTNGLNVEHLLCATHLSRWVFEAGAILSSLSRQEDASHWRAKK